MIMFWEGAFPGIMCKKCSLGICVLLTFELVFDDIISWSDEEDHIPVYRGQKAYCFLSLVWTGKSHHSFHFWFMWEEAPSFSAKYLAALVCHKWQNAETLALTIDCLLLDMVDHIWESRQALQSTRYSSRCLFTPYSIHLFLFTPSLLFNPVVIRIEKPSAQSLF